MFDVVLVLFSLLWFVNTEYYHNWAKIKIGGDQLSISLSALIIVIYVFIGLFSGIRWYFTHRRP